MKKTVIAAVLAVIAFIGISQSMFVLEQGEYAIVKQFGEVVAIYDEPGMKMKMPLMQSVDTLPNKVLVYDLPVSEVITKDKQTMVADSFARPNKAFMVISISVSLLISYSMDNNISSPAKTSSASSSSAPARPASTSSVNP